MTQDQITEWEVSIAAVISVKPGERLLVTLDGSATPEEVAHVSERLRERFPGVEISVLAGATQVIQVHNLDAERLATLESRVRELELDAYHRAEREAERRERSGP